jgi:cytochrome P450
MSGTPSSTTRSPIGRAPANDLFTDVERWGDIDAWNQAALALHESGGIHRIERPGYDPFWAVIDHAAIVGIERRPALFSNEPEPILATQDTIANRKESVKTLIRMDPPEHGKYRQMTSGWFNPSSLGRLDERLELLSNEAVARMIELGGSCDFVPEIAVPYPLQVILQILGLPESDYPRMLKLTQELFGGDDPDIQRAPQSPEAHAAVVRDFMTYFAGISADRRTCPTDDLATLIANGQIDGCPIGEREMMGYYIIVATAGHDTTSSGMAGGLELLVRHQDQLQKLRERPDLVNNAVEEMLRLTSPVRHFMRTVQEDTEICGQKIKKGEWLYLSYKAANLDPKVFTDPLVFDITRSNSDKQICFGFGAHFCLGAQLARNEMRSLFTHLVPRIESIEFDGTPTMIRALLVGGHKTLPIRYRIKNQT